MNSGKLMRFQILLLLIIICTAGFSQSLPVGINYQAVARDNYGKELSEKEIDVRFSIISGDPLGPVVYEELHPDVRTSKFGVFSLVIGKGTLTGKTGNDLSQIDWSQGNLYLKVEVNFESSFLDMGTMQFFAVPYALFAKKSLEPGPPGPKGDPGEPASDDQTLSFNGTNLSISGGNTVNLGSLNETQYLSLKGDTLWITKGNYVTLLNQIQDLQLDVNNKLKITKNPLATEYDLSKYLDNTDNQQLSLTNGNKNLSISGGNSIDLSPVKQDLLLNNDTLSITNKITAPTKISLSKYQQNLAFNSANYKLSISGGNEVDLTSLKNDADADPTNEIQDIHLAGNDLTIDRNPSSSGVNLNKFDNGTLTYDSTRYSLSISNGNSVKLGRIIAFRARKTVSETGLSIVTDYDFVLGTVDYNDGSGYESGSGIFTAPAPGIYTFNVSYNAVGPGDSRKLKISLNGGLYDILNSGINSGSEFTRSITMKLVAGDKVKVLINTGMSNDSGTGSFSGFRVY
jgi:hypothetical protein